MQNAPVENPYFSVITLIFQLERSRTAEAEVEAWRSKGILPFPEFPIEQREQLLDTLDFPPEGSPNARPTSDNGNNGQEN